MEASVGQGSNDCLYPMSLSSARLLIGQGQPDQPPKLGYGKSALEVEPLCGLGDRKRARNLGGDPPKAPASAHVETQTMVEKPCMLMSAYQL